MFTKETRDARLKTAYVRMVRSATTVERARAAEQRHEAAKNEVEWLRNAPVSDGEAGSDLPTEDELNAHVEQVRARVRKGGDDEVDNVPADQPTLYDDNGNVIV